MTFIRLLKLTEQGIQAIGKQKEAYMEVQKIIEDNGGKLVGSWFTQGEYDLISIIDTEDEKSMRTISARLAVKGLYTGKTLPAMTLEDFMRRFGDGPEVAMFLETWFRSGRKDRRR
ncbi:MAG: GYD domain-containing protein [Myxococcota bacterium]